MANKNSFRVFWCLFLISIIQFFADFSMSFSTSADSIHDVSSLDLKEVKKESILPSSVSKEGKLSEKKISEVEQKTEKNQEKDDEEIDKLKLSFLDTLTDMLSFFDVFTDMYTDIFGNDFDDNDDEKQQKKSNSGLLYDNDTYENNFNNTSSSSYNVDFDDDDELDGFMNTFFGSSLSSAFLPFSFSPATEEDEYYPSPYSFSSISNITNNFMTNLFNFETLPYFFDALFAPLVGMLYRTSFDNNMIITQGGEGGGGRITTVVDENEKVCKVNVDMSNLPSTSIMQVEVENDGVVLIYFSNGQVMSIQGEEDINKRRNIDSVVDNNFLTSLLSSSSTDNLQNNSNLRAKLERGKKQDDNSNNILSFNNDVDNAKKIKEKKKEQEHIDDSSDDEISTQTENKNNHDKNNLNKSVIRSITNNNNNSNDSINNIHNNYDNNHNVIVSTPDTVSIVYSTTTFLLDKRCDANSDDSKATIQNEVLIMKFALKKCAYENHGEKCEQTPEIDVSGDDKYDMVDDDNEFDDYYFDHLYNTYNKKHKKNYKENSNEDSHHNNQNNNDKNNKNIKIIDIEGENNNQVKPINLDENSKNYDYHEQLNDNHHNNDDKTQIQKVTKTKYGEDAENYILKKFVEEKNFDKNSETLKKRQKNITNLGVPIPDPLYMNQQEAPRKKHIVPLVKLEEF